MKNKILSFLVILLVLISCETFDEINTNPNQATDASIQVIYPAAMASFVYGMNGESAQFTSILMQYLTGILGDQQQVNNYSFIADMSDATWNRFYSNCLNNLRIVKEKSEELGANHYLGTSKIMEAIIIGYSVDLWNDIPYSEALNLEQFPQPRFDDAAALYQRVQSLLDEGIADLQRQSSTSPSTNDLIYRAANENAWRANSLPKWIMLARAMKARYHNHLSKVDPAGSASATLAAIDAGSFMSNADQPIILFGSEFAGPWFPYFQTTFGENNVGISQRFIDLLRDRISEGTDDPRLTRFVSPTTGGLYVGVPNGSSFRPAGTVVPGPYLNSREAPTPLLNFSELKFIEAEAALRAGQSARAATAHNAAVAASLQRITGSANADYIARYGSETESTITLEKIMEEKHIDLFLQPEAWMDWRRTIPVGSPNTVSGLPSLTVSPSNTTQGNFPRRFIYPNREVVNNSANVPDVSNLDRVFWDR
ncbi:SusD/RagB family nutrient-binding outer membrane lipoprotein [Mongoliitalea daihaiensis]|uniref:SusD/RagB family nutrient-binding outer membrane lipoprotein n=1 Tax=Mongoliitalea daihaiensis TaxID=2782006 RepID=UPI001F2B52FB|nr:SusD/RagB family nutrient-binding outer membrane lipoprotein [Mongoliitalea daihaiensis]UJP64432.1 SusD/RagB family nutrient-binding outer membrane lipoprotein [Mongoliitalea daihaiensis]